MGEDGGARRTVGIVRGDDADDGTHGHLNLPQDDDLAMGAPPGVPGATAPVATQAGEEEGAEEDEGIVPSETLRQTMAPLPLPIIAPIPRPSVQVPCMEDEPYRKEDVLIALLLLACLRKYPHVRQAFYKKRVGATPKPEPAEASQSSSSVSHRESALGGFARALVGNSPNRAASPLPPPIAGPSRIVPASASTPRPTCIV
ncbi:hypothetical protein AURDEDRAFT_185708 [Auricularia subglabra TFB-10046 SS5]|nr:hypothetical protein AURDEDRAFT_185708 [Auricularia subglabra TFB-10046 SS5]